MSYGKSALLERRIRALVREQANDVLLQEFDISQYTPQQVQDLIRQYPNALPNLLGGAGALAAGIPAAVAGGVGGAVTGGTAGAAGGALGGGALTGGNPLAVGAGGVAGTALGAGTGAALGAGASALGAGGVGYMGGQALGQGIQNALLGPPAPTPPPGPPFPGIPGYPPNPPGPVPGPPAPAPAPSSPSGALKQIQNLLGVPQTGTWDKATNTAWTEWLKNAADKLQDEDFPTDLATNWKGGAPKVMVSKAANNPAAPFKGDYTGMLAFITAANQMSTTPAQPGAPAAPAPAQPGAAPPQALPNTGSIVASSTAQSKTITKGTDVVITANLPKGPGGENLDLDRVKALVYNIQDTQTPVKTVNPLIAAGKGKKSYTIKVPTDKLDAGTYFVKITGTTPGGKEGYRLRQSNPISFTVK